MTRSKRRLRCAFGLAALALGLLGAGSAQAAPTWMVKESNLTSGEKSLKGSVVGESLSLLTKILGSEVKFSCKKAELLSAALKSEGKLSEGTKVRFTECKTSISGKEAPACEPKNNGTEKGVIVTNGLKGELTEHSEEGVFILKSTVEEEISKVKQPVFARIKTSEECAIGESVPIFGPKMGLVDSGGLPGLMNETVVHKLKQGPLTELWAVNKTEEHKVTLDGEAEASLVSGEVWNGLAVALPGLTSSPIWWTFLLVNAEKTFTIENVGAAIADLTIRVIDNDTDFKISGTNCTATLAVGASCQVSVRCINLAKVAMLEAKSVAQGARSLSLLKS